MDRKRHARGLARRKEVLGSEFVDATLKKADVFSQPFQALVNEYVWGVAWADPALDARTRGLLNLGMTAALGRFSEFETHMRAAMRNGLTREELQAALIQIAIYCGMPIGVECFRTASRVLAETAATPTMRSGPRAKPRTRK